MKFSYFSRIGSVRFSQSLTFICATILFGSQVSFAQNAPPPLPRAPQARVTTLTAPGHHSEPSVAVNPANPKQIVVAYQSPYQSPANIAYSPDAGVHWQTAANTSPNLKVSGDVSVTYDNKGHALLCYIAFNKLGTFNYWGHAGSTNGIFIRRSLDGGKSWEPSPITVSGQTKRPGVPMEDKPYIVADTSHGPYAGNLYIAWTRWSLADSRMVFSRSTDDGKTWSTPMEIDRHPGLPRDDNGALEGFDGAVGADSTLYAVWSYGNNIQFTTSRDGGKTFGEVKDILLTAPTMFAVQDFQRANGFPQIAVDSRRGNYKNAHLYVTWSDYRNGDIDVFCAVSTDGGRHWDAPVRVNNDPIHDGADQFFQWLTVDPVSGAVSVLFYDRRFDPENRKTAVSLARSTDGGKTFTNYAWSVKPFVASEKDFMGDYSGIASYGDRVYGVWTEATAAPEKTQSLTKGQPSKPDGPKSQDAKPAEMAAKDTEVGKRPKATTIVRVGVADFSGLGRSGNGSAGH